MKISEKLSCIKQQEGELLRLYDLRDSVVKKPFQDNLIKTEGLTDSDVEEKRKQFLKNKKERIQKIDSKIDTLKISLIAGKNVLNTKNIELGLDIKLIEMKYLRLELSKLMKMIKSEISWSSKLDVDVDVIDALGLNERIHDLEKRKVKLDSEIQITNWTTEL